MEEFKIIPNAPNYEISNRGRVRNAKTKRTVCPGIAKNKFNIVTSCHIMLSNGEKRVNYMIHRLVANAFIPNPELKPIVDHIDRDPTNNDVSNLRWATFLENAHNRSLSRNNTTGEANIFFDTIRNKYHLRYNNEYKKYSCGFYDTLEEAIEAKRTGNYKKKHSNVNEKFIKYNKKTNKFIFQKSNNAKGQPKTYYTKQFKTLQEAIEARNEYCKNNDISISPF